jgi:hypothetical protein
LAKARCPSHIRKILIAEIAIEVVGLIGEIGDEEVEISVMIVIAEINSHGAQFLTIFTKGDA